MKLFRLVPGSYAHYLVEVSGKQHVSYWYNQKQRIDPVFQCQDVLMRCTAAEHGIYTNIFHVIVDCFLPNF